MLERLYGLARRLLSLAEDTRQNKSNVKQLEERLDRLRVAT